MYIFYIALINEFSVEIPGHKGLVGCFIQTFIHFLNPSSQYQRHTWMVPFLLSLIYLLLLNKFRKYERNQQLRILNIINVWSGHISMCWAKRRRNKHAQSCVQSFIYIEFLQDPYTPPMINTGTLYV